MKEIWEQALLSYNLPLTVLLGLVMLFWMVSLLGAFDLDSFDADVEIDADGGDVEGGEGVLGFLLRAVNAQDVPVMMVLSLLSLFMWLVAIVSNYYLNPGESGLIAFGLLAGNFIFSVILVKFVTQPLRPVFRSIKNDKEHQEPLVGSSGTVKSRVLDEGFGQCEVHRPKGSPALLNCRMAEGEDPLVHGDGILVIGYDESSQKYIIKPLSNKTTES